MKNLRKALLAVLCAALLMVATVMGTVAYLQDEDSVTNTFTVGMVRLTLDETDVDEDANEDDNVAVGGVVRDKANRYKLLPGKEYVKDPIIHVDEDSEDCFLFVKVVDQIAPLQADKTVAAQMAEKGWIAVPGVENTFVYADGGKPKAVAAGADIPVFETFTIKGDVDNDELAEYKDKTITVTAYAVQKEGFADQAAETIWNTAFGSVAGG